MVTSLLLACALKAQTIGFTPNYADRLLTPFEGTDVRAQLFPARRNNPILIAVMPDPSMVTDDRLNIVREACERWTAATANQPRVFQFDYIETFGPVHPDVVITFVAMKPTGTTRGVTKEEGGWASMRLAVTDSLGVPLSRDAILRVATHEMGHALGIWGHSPNPTDTMSLAEGVSKISAADVNTLELAYFRPEDGNFIGSAEGIE